MQVSSQAHSPLLLPILMRAFPDRQKKKNEALASEIFGKGRRASAPSATLGARKSGVGGSLASRMGAKKVTPPFHFLRESGV